MSSYSLMAGAVGCVITLTVTEDGTAVDLSMASTKQIIIVKPNGTKLTKSAAFTTNGSDGKLQYTTIANDIDLAGRYCVQAYVVTPVFTGYSSITEFMVGENL